MDLRWLRGDGIVQPLFMEIYDACVMGRSCPSVTSTSLSNACAQTLATKRVPSLQMELFRNLRRYFESERGPEYGTNRSHKNVQRKRRRSTPVSRPGEMANIRRWHRIGLPCKLMCFIEVSAFREPRTELTNRSPRAVCANAQDECCFDLDTRIPRYLLRATKHGTTVRMSEVTT